MKNMKNYTWLFSSLLLLQSCVNSKEETISKLTDGACKYWDLTFVINKNGEKFKKSKTKLFCADGSFKEYITNGNDILDIHEGSDVILPNKWEFLSANSIKINDWEIKINLLTDDSLVYTNDGEEFHFRKSLDQSERVIKSRWDL